MRNAMHRRLTAVLAAALLVTLPALSGLPDRMARSAAAAGEPGRISRPWSDEVLYFIMVDRFHNGDPSNDGGADRHRPRWYHGGDLQGIIDKLDYIQGLGATGIWITPVVSQIPRWRGSDGYHGYWTLDPYRINPQYGDMAKLQELVQAAHARGMRVILDVVLNHMGYDHPWLAAPDRQDWFHPRAEMNFSSQSSIEQAWLAGLPDLNTENPAVRRYLIDWSLWIIEQTGVDGFRVDTAKHMPLDFLAEFTAAVKGRYPDFFLLGEVWTSDYKAQAAYQQVGFDSVTDFYTYDQIQKALSVPGTSLTPLALPPGAAEGALPNPDGRATFIDNHDRPRFAGIQATEQDAGRMRVALAYLLTMPGMPVIYYGTEVVLAGGNDPDNRRDMPWTSPPFPEVRDYLSRLAGLRRQLAALRQGEFVRVYRQGSHLLYARTLGEETVLVALNGGQEPWKETVTLEGITLPDGTALVNRLAADPAQAERLVVSGGSLALHVPPLDALVLTVPPPEGAPWWSYAAGIALGLALGFAAWRWAQRRSGSRSG